MHNQLAVVNPGEAPNNFIPFKSFAVYQKDINRYPLLTSEQVLDLAQRSFDRKEQEARQKLVEGNLKLVVKIATKYGNNHLDVLDLIQEGNIGLMRAAEKYDPSRNTMFSSYAGFWIRAFILKYIIDNWSIVRIGTTRSQRKLFYRLENELLALRNEGEAGAITKLANKFKVSEKDIQEMGKILNFSDISLEAPVEKNGKSTYGETLNAGTNYEEIILNDEEKRIIKRLFADFRSTLSDIEIFVFENRICCDDEDVLSLRQIGDIKKISYETVRKAEKKTRKKLTDFTKTIYKQSFFD